jgi:tetratricopeptide (TPR) repeat protein
LGDIALKQGDAEKALAYFKNALRLDPSNGDPYLGMGRALAQRGDVPKAIEYLRQAVSRMQDKPEPHYWLGQTLIRSGQVLEGKSELAKVDQINAAKRQEAREFMEQTVIPATTGEPLAPR